MDEDGSDATSVDIRCSPPPLDANQDQNHDEEYEPQAENNGNDVMSGFGNDVWDMNGPMSAMNAGAMAGMPNGMIDFQQMQNMMGSNMLSTSS